MMRVKTLSWPYFNANTRWSTALHREKVHLKTFGKASTLTLTLTLSTNLKYIFQKGRQRGGGGRSKAVRRISEKILSVSGCLP